MQPLRFQVLSNEPHPCGYREGQVALQPLRLPLRPPSPTEFDTLLAEGDRRAGPLLYRTECAACRACEALRVDVARFQPSKSQRRVWRRNVDEVRVELGRPLVTPDRVMLYNRHGQERGLARHGPIDLETYEQHYVSSCVPGLELRYLVGDRLIAVSLLDVGKTALSSVYHYFDPDESARSLGVFSVLAELEFAREHGFDWYYLGLWVEDCASLAYKSQYHPHQRLKDGEWRTFDRT